MYLPLLAGGESMGEKWFGLLSDRRAQTLDDTPRERGRYPWEPGADSTIRLTTKLPEPMVNMNKITLAEKELAPNK